MKKKAEEMHYNVGFLDLQVLSATMIQFQTKIVTETIRKAMEHDFVVGAYNTGGHYVLVIIAMKWDVVWYLDSDKAWPKRKFTDVVTIVNCKPKLAHKTDFPCTQQPSGSMLCGFYVALNILDLLADISIMKKASGMLCEFILKEIIDPNGNFYDGPIDAT
ncbi:hypothetical protein PVAP13_5NG343381 [Panicum virgatum]|uniref:Ubiquitin-like protease family profile domain-containing protein n=1 Tax=Panicum virgatum TaxID=38727 RepID=A0A8T0RQ10_PANVG|nr:hypothetical protein PVAP13_5NG343381 [Panicum virgatum]